MLLFIAAVFLVIFGAAGASDPNFPGLLFGVIATVAILINLVFAAPSLIAYYAMKNRKPWARIAAIVAGALAVMNVPFGTLAGVYAFVFFLGEDWKQVYEPQRPPQFLGNEADSALHSAVTITRPPTATLNSSTANRPTGDRPTVTSFGPDRTSEQILV